VLKSALVPPDDDLGIDRHGDPAGATRHVYDNLRKAVTIIVVVGVPIAHRIPGRSSIEGRQPLCRR